MKKEEQLDILYTVLNEISPISKNTWDNVQNHFNTLTLQRGEHLFLINDKVENFYFLISGLARYYYIRDDGKEFNKSFAQKQGHLISSISSVSNDELSPFSVEILLDFTSLYISYEKFIDLGNEYKDWNKLIIKIYEYLVIKKEKRESDFLLLDAQDRYEQFILEYPIANEILPNYHIATYLGITEVALCRIRRQMKLT